MVGLGVVVTLAPRRCLSVAPAAPPDSPVAVHRGSVPAPVSNAIRRLPPCSVLTSAARRPNPVEDRLWIGEDRGPLPAYFPGPCEPASYLGDSSSSRKSGSPARSTKRELQLLRQRLDELETARTAHEDATRTIIRRSFAERGSQINDFVNFGGTFELLTGWDEDFEGQSESVLLLDTAELDFEIQVNSWTLGSFIFEYDNGTNVLFPTNQQDEVAVDRINVDTAFVTVGDTQRFWLYGTCGRVIVPFGISTGAAKGDVLNLEDPLTVEVFETKEDVILIGFEFPTPPPPPLPPTTPPPPPPRVRPLLVNPFVGRLSRCLGYRPRPAGPPPKPIAIPPVPTLPPFTGGIYFYNGNTNDGGEDHIEHIGGTLGYRTQGNFPCRVPILSPGPHSPWSMDIDVDFNSSVFDSRFLEFEYRRFLDQIGFVPGMAAHVKSTFGPVSLIAEWNGAIDHATFVDDLGEVVTMTPSAWQISLGYQFDWNPYVEEIGAQGTYFAIGYSESHGLAGVTRVIDGEEMRIGFAPRKRFLVGVGEWVADGLRVAVEYSHIVDYSEDEGGTGNSANGYFGVLTYEW